MQRARRTHHVRDHPVQRAHHPHAHRRRPLPFPPSAEPRRGGDADGLRAPCRDVRRLDRVHQVAGGEDPRRARGAIGSTGRAAGPRIDGEAGDAGQFVVGDEVPAEDDGVDRHRAFLAPRSPDEHAVDPVAPVHPRHCRPGPDRHPEAGPGQEIEEAEGLRARLIRHQGDRTDTRLAQRQHGGIGDVLGAHDEGSPAHGQVLPVHPLLELAGGEDPGGPAPRDQAGRPRALPGPRGQHHRAGVHLEQTVRTGQLGAARRRPARHHGAGPDVDPARPGAVHPPPGVLRATQDAAQVAHAETGVGAEAGRPARLLLPVDDDDAARAARPGGARGGEAGGAGTDHEGVDRQDRSAHADSADASRAATAAPQKKP